MEENKSSISKAKTYREIGEFWDENDLTNFSEQIQPVEFEVEIESNTTYFPVESFDKTYPPRQTARSFSRNAS